MRVLNEKLCADILETGRKEFLALGYRDASLRHIAASLGVTTGAIYRYYADKEALFDALIACCAGGTKYEHYLDTLAEIEDNAGRALIEKMAEAGYSLPQIDDELIHIMSSALFNGIFETVRHDMPREKALRYMASLRDFYSAGWFKLLGISDT